jgi:hypothetical protein
MIEKMSINIKRRNQKWRLEMREEVWEFQTQEEFEKHLKYLVDLKTQYGNLGEHER